MRRLSFVPSFARLLTYGASPHGNIIEHLFVTCQGNLWDYLKGDFMKDFIMLFPPLLSTFVMFLWTSYKYVEEGCNYLEEYSIPFRLVITTFVAYISSILWVSIIAVVFIVPLCFLFQRFSIKNSFNKGGFSFWLNWIFSFFLIWIQFFIFGQCFPLFV